MASSSIARCPSLRANASNLGRASSLKAPRRSLSLAASGRKLSVDCNAAAAFNCPAPEEPEQLPEPSSLTWDEQIQKAALEDSWDNWEDDAAMMPWAAGLNIPSASDATPSTRNPVVFLPEATRDPLFEELQYYMDKMVTAERDTPAFCILFGLGTDHTEGIYTLRTVDTGIDGEQRNVDTVLAFEEEVDALRFTTMLEASLGHEPCVYATSWGEITDWCGENNTRCRLEPGGSLIIPPEANVAVTDWERALSLQMGMYSVLDEEPVVDPSAINPATAALAPGFFIDGPDWVYQPDGVEDTTADLSNIVDSKLADSSIASIREDLERLLNH